MAVASVGTSWPTSGLLDVEDYLYKIVSYTSGRLVAVETAGCVTNTLTIDTAFNSAVFVRKKRPDVVGDKFCDALDDLFETEIIDGMLAIKRMH